MALTCILQNIVEILRNDIINDNFSYMAPWIRHGCQPNPENFPSKILSKNHENGGMSVPSTLGWEQQFVF